MKPERSVSVWLKQARADLTKTNPDEPITSLYALLEKHSGHPRAWLLANPNFILPQSVQVPLQDDLHALQNGKPLAYILGTWDFYGMSFLVNPAVLIPRPETELLVETALEILQQEEPPNLIADVGTGSGCIAAAIAKHQPHTSVISTDISLPALQTAKQNIRLHSLQEQICLVQGDLLSTVGCQFDLICANLPYIPSATLEKLPISQFEPVLALDGGQDGLGIIRELFSQASLHLKAGGSMLLEMQYDQANAVRELVDLHFPGAEVIIKKDLADHDRLAVIHI